jgi:hypothetical protein
LSQSIEHGKMTEGNVFLGLEKSYSKIFGYGQMAAHILRARRFCGFVQWLEWVKPRLPTLCAAPLTKPTPSARRSFSGVMIPSATQRIAHSLPSRFSYHADYLRTTSNFARQSNLTHIAVRNSFLGILMAQPPRLVPYVKIFVTSRLEYAIERAFERLSPTCFSLDPDDPENVQDVQRYINQLLDDAIPPSSDQSDQVLSPIRASDPPKCD